METKDSNIRHQKREASLQLKRVNTCRAEQRRWHPHRQQQWGTVDSNTNGATLESNGARILSYGSNNQIIGTSGSGFTETASLQ